jgi:hypothetical protein
MGIHSINEDLLTRELFYTYPISVEDEYATARYKQYR